MPDRIVTPAMAMATWVSGRGTWQYAPCMSSVPFFFPSVKCFDHNYRPSQSSACGSREIGVPSGMVIYSAIFWKATLSGALSQAKAGHYIVELAAATKQVPMGERASHGTLRHFLNSLLLDSFSLCLARSLPINFTRLIESTLRLGAVLNSFSPRSVQELQKLVIRAKPMLCQLCACPVDIKVELLYLRCYTFAPVIKAVLGFLHSRTEFLQASFSWVHCTTVELLLSALHSAMQLFQPHLVQLECADLLSLQGPAMTFFESFQSWKGAATWAPVSNTPTRTSNHPNQRRSFSIAGLFKGLQCWQAVVKDLRGFELPGFLLPGVPKFTAFCDNRSSISNGCTRVCNLCQPL